MATLAVALTTIVGLASCGEESSDSSTEPNILIQADDQPYTMINVLTPTEGTQDEVVEALQEGLGQQVAEFPGFISAALHRSMDDDTVVVYAQWESKEAVDDAVEAIGAGEAPAMATAFTIADPDFHPFDVVSVNPAIED